MLECRRCTEKSSATRPCLTVRRLCCKTNKYELSGRCMRCIIERQKCEWPAGAISKNAGSFYSFNGVMALLTLLCVRRTSYARLYNTLHRGPVCSCGTAGSNVDSVQCLWWSCSYQFVAQEHGEGNLFRSAYTRPFLSYCDKAAETYFPHQPPAVFAEALHFA